MTYVSKASGDRTRPLEAEYRCPVHGVFTCVVLKDERGEAPDDVSCPAAALPKSCLDCKLDLLDGEAECDRCGRVYEAGECGQRSMWTPSKTVAARVKRYEVVRGKWEEPERPTYLDTRDLGEGQDPDDFRDNRTKIWEEHRHKAVKEML